MKTFLWIFWPLARGATWGDRLRMLRQALLLFGGLLAILAGFWLLAR